MCVCVWDVKNRRVGNSCTDKAKTWKDVFRLRDREGVRSVCVCVCEAVSVEKKWKERKCLGHMIEDKRKK